MYGQVFAPEQVFCHADAPCVDSLDERLSGVAAEEGSHGRAVHARVCGMSGCTITTSPGPNGSHTVPMVRMPLPRTT